MTVKPKKVQRKRSVRLGKTSSRKVMDRSRVWLVCAASVFFVSYSVVAVRVVELSLPKEGVMQAMVSGLSGEKTVAGTDDSVSLLGLMRDGVTTESLGLKDEELTREVVMARSNIVDRNGVVLASSLETASLYANPKEIAHPESVARALAATLPKLTFDKIHKRLTSGKSFVWMQRNLTPKEQQLVNNLGEPGLHFQTEYARSYPQGNLFSHVLGFVGVDNKGLAGVERYFDKRLLEANDGEPLKLSVDVRLQYMLHNELEIAMKEFRAIGATGVVMHVPSGELMAMANLPDFDPNHPTKSDKKNLFNRATLGAYEMGSTFKTFTMAMGLEHEVVDIKGGYDTTKPIKFARHTIRDSHPRIGWHSVPEIFAYSSNIGTVRMAMDVGADKQKNFMERLGMFSPISLELPELARPLYPKDWRDINMMTISYGHGISVSPMHLVQGIGTMINGGVPQNMTLLRDGNAHKPKAAPLISEKTSTEVRRLMRTVVKHGTGRKAGVQGYRVGGKTGTAEKAVNGRYRKDDKLASFVGAFPMDDPEYLILVMLDEPRGNKRTYNYATGGWVAAPVVARMVEQMGPMLGVPPVFEEAYDDMDRYWPDYKRKSEKEIRAAKGGVHAAAFKSR